MRDQEKCGEWKDRGYCTDKNAKIWMLENCPSACALPPTVVVGATPPRIPTVAPLLPPVYVPVAQPVKTAQQPVYVPFAQPTQTEIEVNFGTILDDKKYEWLRPLFEIYRSNTLPFRYEYPLMLSATYQGYSVDPPERNAGAAGADGFQLNVNSGNGLSFSGAIYIDTSSRVRLVVRSYRSTPVLAGVPAKNELRAYRETPLKCDKNIRECAFSADQAWIELDSPGHRLPIRSYVPIPQPRAPVTIAPIRAATGAPQQHMMVDFNVNGYMSNMAKRISSGAWVPYDWLSPLVLFYLNNVGPNELGQRIGNGGPVHNFPGYVPFRYEPYLFNYGSPPLPDMAANTDGFLLSEYVDAFAYTGVIYIDTKRQIRLVVRKYKYNHAQRNALANPLFTLDAKLEACTAPTVAGCITTADRVINPAQKQTWKASNGTRVLEFVRVQGLTRLTR
jgi:hypothetical protein